LTEQKTTWAAFPVNVPLPGGRRRAGAGRAYGHAGANEPAAGLLQGRVADRASARSLPFISGEYNSFIRM